MRKLTLNNILKKLIFLFVLVFCATSIASADTINLNIVSGNPGGTYYYIGAAIASILSQKLPDVEVTTTATTGSPLENGTYTSRSTDTMGIFTLDGAYTAMKGDASRGFREPLTNLGMLVGGHELLLYAITLKDSGVKSHGDVKGKKIGIPVLGNTAYYQTVALLEEYGLKENKDYKSYPMTYAEQTDALKDGAIDVAYTGGGIPQAHAMELSTTKDVLFLSIDEDKIEVLGKKHPYWWISQIPANTYRGQDYPVNVFTSQVCLFANLGMDEELAYKITKTICESTAELKQIHIEAGKYSAETTKPLYESPVVPFHPGALKYYKELWGK